MEYEPKTYFDEQEEQSVKGFTVLSVGAGGDEYHIAEKWTKEDGDGEWVRYSIPEAQLLSRVSDGACEPKGKLTDEQFEQVCQFTGFDPEEWADSPVTTEV